MFVLGSVVLIHFGLATVTAAIGYWSFKRCFLIQKQLTVHLPWDSLPGVTPEVKCPAHGYKDNTRSIDHVFTFEFNVTSKLTLLTFLIHISGLVRDSKEKKSCFQSFIKTGHIFQHPASSKWINQVIPYFVSTGIFRSCICHILEVKWVAYAI